MAATVAAACGEPGEGSNGTSPDLPTVIATYTRFGQAGDERDLELTYAPPAFFDAFDQDVPPAIANGEAMLFLLRENVHEGELPEQMVEIAVRKPTGELVYPSSVELLTDGVHHRSARLFFPLGQVGLSRVELVVIRRGEVAPGTVPFVWHVSGATGSAAGTEGG